MSVLRVVPANPDPAEFPPRRFACLDRAGVRSPLLSPWGLPVVRRPCDHCDMEVCRFDAPTVSPAPTPGGAA